MEYRKIGITEIEVSVVALGCWGLISDPNWGEQDQDLSIKTVHAALDAGINFFDTAEGYGDGRSEQVLAKALAGRRQEAIIASKVSQNHLALVELKDACERSLRNLNTDYIDLYQIHWPSRTIPLSETVGALEALQQAGKIRAIGISNFGVGDLGDLLTTAGNCETNQLPYNLLWRAIEFDIRKLCIDNNIGILAYSPLMQGMLTGKFASAAAVPDARARTKHFSTERPLARHGGPGYEAETFAAIDRIREIAAGAGQSMASLALAWLLHQRGVTSVIAGARNPDQIAANVQGAGLALSPEVLNDLNEATIDLKEKLGPDPDMWSGKSRYR